MLLSWTRTRISSKRGRPRGLLLEQQFFRNYANFFIAASRDLRLSPLRDGGGRSKTGPTDRDRNLRRPFGRIARVEETASRFSLATITQIISASAFGAGYALRSGRGRIGSDRRRGMRAFTPFPSLVPRQFERQAANVSFRPPTSIYALSYDRTSSGFLTGRRRDGDMNDS